MTARERRVVIWGALILAAAAAVRPAGVVVGRAKAALARANETIALTNRARELIAESPARQAVLRDRATEIVGLASALVSGSSAAEAGAALAGELNALASRHRLALARFDPLQDSAIGMVRAARVRLEAQGDLAGIYGFLHELETGPLLLSFTDLAIATQDADSRMERLRIEATVVGLLTPSTAVASRTARLGDR